MATLKQISDGLMTKLAAVTGLSSGIVVSYPGPLAEFIGKGTLVPPFALVRLTGLDYEDPGVVDNSIDAEGSSWEIILATQDFRGQSYSSDANYTLLDAVLTAIQGAVLTGYIAAVPAIPAVPAHDEVPEVPEVPAVPASYPVLAALEPVKLGSVALAEDNAESGIVAYSIRVSTGQVRQ